MLVPVMAAVFSETSPSTATRYSPQPVMPTSLPLTRVQARSSGIPRLPILNWGMSTHPDRSSFVARSSQESRDARDIKTTSASLPDTMRLREKSYGAPQPSLDRGSPAETHGVTCH